MRQRPNSRWPEPPMAPADCRTDRCSVGFRTQLPQSLVQTVSIDTSRPTVVVVTDSALLRATVRLSVAGPSAEVLVLAVVLALVVRLAFAAVVLEQGLAQLLLRRTPGRSRRGSPGVQATCTLRCQSDRQLIRAAMHKSCAPPVSFCRVRVRARGAPWARPGSKSHVS
jgi:hypothetical protein